MNTREPMNNIKKIYYIRNENEHFRYFRGEHSLLACFMNYLGNVSKAQGKFNSVEGCFRLALSMYEVIYGNDHPDIAGVLYNLGNLLAEQYFKKALDIQIILLGANYVYNIFKLSSTK